MEIENNKINKIQKSDLNNNQINKKPIIKYKEKDYFNSLNPMEYIGRSQVIFRGLSIDNGIETNLDKKVQDDETIKKNLLSETIKDVFGESPRFAEYEVDKLIKLRKQDPVSFDMLLNEKTIDKNGNEIPKFNKYEIEKLMLLRKPLDKQIIKLFDLKDNNKQQILTFNEIIKIIYKLTPEQLKILNVKNKDGTSRYDKSFILNYADGKIDNKIINNADKIAKNNEFNNYIIMLNDNTLQDNTYKLLFQKENSYACIIYNADGNILRKDIVGINGKNTFINEKGNQVEYFDKNNKTIKRQSCKTVKDTNGNILYTERFEPSEVEGKFDIIRKVNGRIYKIGTAEKTPSGLTVIEKTFDLENGTKVDGATAKQSYVYAESPNNNERLIYTLIKDNNGNQLLEHKMNYKKIDDNHFMTKENGLTYDIQYFDDKVVVEKNDGEKVEISIGENKEGTEGVISKDLIPLLKKAPGSAYFAIAECNLTKIGKDINYVEKNNAHFNNNKALIAMSDELSDEKNIFVFLHELGHALDYKKDIHKNPELLKIYEEERNNLLKNGALPEFDDMSYFVSAKHYSEGGAITEIIAETNAKLSATNPCVDTEHREELLQQYFPRTFAKIAELLQN